jgi:hypothetical protein
MSVKVGSVPCYTASDGPKAFVNVYASRGGVEIAVPKDDPTFSCEQARALEALVRVAREIAERMQDRLLRLEADDRNDRK